LKLEDYIRQSLPDVEVVMTRTTDVYSSVVEKEDTRKVRLTLRQINQLRLQAEAHNAEHQSELGFIQQMYATPVSEETAA
jgi:hypothetical protein